MAGDGNLAATKTEGQLRADTFPGRKKNCKHRQFYFLFQNEICKFTFVCGMFLDLQIFHFCICLSEGSGEKLTA